MKHTYNLEGADWLPFKYPIIPYIKGKRILSIGCGIGISELQFARKDSLGIDCIPENVKVARDRGFRVVQGFAQEVKLKEKFEVVAIIHLLEHIETKDDLEKILKLAYDSCKDGGIVVVSTPYIYDSAAWTHYDHARGFTINSLSEWVEKVGFEVINSYSMWHLPCEPYLLTKFGIGNYRCQFQRDYILKLLAAFNLVRDIWVIAEKRGVEK